MAMQHLENELRRTGDPRKQAFADVIAGIHKSLGSDIPFPSVAVPVEKQTVKTFSKDQLIIPDQVPQYVLDVLKRAEKAGLTSFEAYHLSGVTLNKDSNVDEWDIKPEDWYWEQINNGKVSQDAPKLPDAWVLIDKIQKPDYEDGKQMYENDPFGPLLKQLREDKKIQAMKGIQDTSRFGICHDELTQVVLPEIANLLGVDKSQVRLPKEIEFNVIGNLKHQEWGKTNTWEWFADKFGDGYRLIGGHSVYGGLSFVLHYWFVVRNAGRAFRPLVVVSPKA